MDQLPDELLTETALNLSLSDLEHACSTSNRFNQLICDNNVFWRKKFKLDYGYLSEHTSLRWKHKYSTARVYYHGTITNDIIIPYLTYSNVDAFRLGQSDNYLYSLDQYGYLSVDGESTGIQAVHVVQGFIRYIYINPNYDIYDNIGKYIGKGHDITTSMTISYLLMIDLNDNLWLINEDGSFKDLQQKAIHVTSGNLVTAIITPEGYLGIYENTDLSSNSLVTHPHIIPDGKVKQVSIGNKFILVIMSDDSVISLDFVLGSINLGLKARKVSMSYKHGLILDFYGNVWGIGDNRRGQIIPGGDDHYSMPILLPGIKARDINASYSISWILGDIEQ